MSIFNSKISNFIQSVKSDMNSSGINKQDSNVNESVSVFNNDEVDNENLSEYSLYTTQDTTEEIADLYEDLANANSTDERDMVLAKIKEKQEEFGLDNDELALSNQQIERSISASYSEELSDLYAALSECTNEDQKDTINREIKEKEKEEEYNTFIEEYIKETTDKN